MSTILDALQRAQRERNPQTPTAVPGSVPHPPSRPLTALAVGVIAITLLLITAALWRIAVRLPPPGIKPQPALPAASAVPVAMQSATDPQAASQAMDAPMFETVQQHSVEPLQETRDNALGEVEDVAQYLSLDDVAPVYRGTDGATTEPQHESISEALSEPLDRERTPTTTPPTAVDLSATAITPVTSSTATPPLWNGRRQPQLASLTLQVHVYDADPARRWIMIEGRRINEGGSLPAGGTLKEIRADGLVIRIGGETVWWPLAH